MSDLEAEVQPVFSMSEISLDDFLRERSRMTSSSQAQFAWNMVTGQVGYSPRMVEEGVSQVLAAAEGMDRWCYGRGERRTPLGDRLKGLHADLDTAVASKLELDVNKWADWTVWARHHVAHGGSEQHREIDDYAVLKHLTNVTQLVTYLSLVTRLGVTPSRQLDALGSNRGLRRLRASCERLTALADDGISGAGC